MRENLPLRFLYGTALGRFFLKLFVMPGVSKFGGALLDTKVSKLFIKGFMKKNRIHLDDIIVQKNGFASFNDFFKRKRKDEAILIDGDKNRLISPCDAFLSVYDIGENSVFTIKGVPYSLTGLLREKKLAASFKGGKALVFRLTPTHYHRYSFAETGRIIFEKKINGELHCVRPIAMEKFPVFIQNAREYIVTETETFGRLIQMEVGALMVGKISNHEHGGKAVRGEEKGCFEFGGSTIILLVQKDMIDLREDLISALNSEEEVGVSLGEAVGKRKNDEN